MREAFPSLPFGLPELEKQQQSPQQQQQQQQPQQQQPQQQQRHNHYSSKDSTTGETITSTFLAFTSKSSAQHIFI